jgi:alkylated DNA repair dioxygenase AlkB
MWEKYFVLNKQFLSAEEASLALTHVYNNVPRYSILSNAAGEDVRISREMAYMYERKVDYSYAGLTLPGQVWTSQLRTLAERVSSAAGMCINSVLINVYRDGRDEIRWHADREPQLGFKPVIPTLNLGASRTFWFLHRPSGEKTSVVLEHGDLLVMLEDCQIDCMHAVLKEKHVKDPRVSLTFRNVVHD